MQAGGLVPILSLGHLGHLTGASYRYLRDIVERTRDPYLDITRPKKSGGTRAISSPEPVLMDVQRWLLRNVFNRVEPHPSSHAYCRNRSIRTCASEHVGARWLMKFDLHDFFDMVTEREAYGQLRRLGYPELISLEIARVCTRLSVDPANYQGRHNRYTVIKTYSMRRTGVLPQGGPTSGAIANGAAHTLDRKLTAFAAERSLVYTRYSDDLVFSSSDRFDRSVATKYVSHVGNLVGDHGFLLHRKKTRVIPPGARHIVLGLLLGPDDVRLLPEFKRRIEQHVRGVSRFGLREHAAHRSFRSVIGFVNHVDGCLAFAAGIEPAFAAKLRDAWDSSLAGAGYVVSS